MAISVKHFYLPYTMIETKIYSKTTKKENCNAKKNFEKVLTVHTYRPNDNTLKHIFLWD